MEYVVKSGDSLSKIARDILGNIDLWPIIAQENNITTPYTIYPGNVLTLPIVLPEVTVMPTQAKAGFTGWAVALLAALIGVSIFVAHKKQKNK